MCATLKKEFFLTLLKRLTSISETFEHKNPEKRRNANLGFPFRGEK
jgi:hypothetical protein